MKIYVVEETYFGKHGPETCPISAHVSREEACEKIEKIRSNQMYAYNVEPVEFHFPQLQMFLDAPDRKGWGEDQFAARQIAKMAEELADLAGYIHSTDEPRLGWEVDLKFAASVAREDLDNDKVWENASIEAPYDAVDKLVNIVRMAICIAEVLDIYEQGSGADFIGRLWKE